MANKKPEIRVFVTRALPEPALHYLRARYGQVDINPHDRPLTRDELLEAVKNRDGVLCLLTDTIDEAVLKAANRARIFANCAVGVNNVDLAAATRLGIMVTNTPGVLTETTADLTLALILAVTRRLTESERFLREGRFRGWGPMLLLGTDIRDKTLGLLGAGRIGSAVAYRAAAFGMNMIYHDRQSNHELEQNLRARRVSFEELLEQSDVLSIHVPLNESTHHLIDARALERMKKTAFLINTSRGSVIDEAALAEHLRAGGLRGAGLDVYENEPRVHEDLLTSDRAVLLPHIGSATEETRTRMAMMAAENLAAGLEGRRPPQLVNPETWSRSPRSDS
ncbi:MAG TPA: D-glycerate dehydrogenase [bacterium]|nr:D-glycerate dehydrogenase [bacterium]